MWIPDFVRDSEDWQYFCVMMCMVVICIGVYVFGKER